MTTAMKSQLDTPPTAKRARWWWFLALFVPPALWAADAWKYDFVPKRWRTVIPGQVYRSGQLSPRLIGPMLEQHKIRVVVDLTGELEQDREQQAEDDACRRLGIIHERFPLGGDGTGDIRRYAGAIKAIDRAVHRGEPVLVHCSAGSQRTGGVIAAYRLLVRRDPVQDVRAELEAAGWTEDNNPLLLPYVNEHLAELAELLASEGVIDAVPHPLPKL